MKGGDVLVKQRVREIIRFAGLILPFLLAMYSLVPGVDKPYVLEPSGTNGSKKPEMSNTYAPAQK